jgi:crotonobetainyl-CoA:carnitine CoA-transferase CaiB-like acyl-CoA transferase
MDQRLVELLREVDLGPPAEDVVEISGHDPVLPNRYPVGEAAAVALAAGGIAAAELWRMKTGRQQRVRVDVRRAAVSLRPNLVMRLDGGPPPHSPADDNPLVQLYQCSDGRWVHVHGVFPHLAEGTLKVLGCTRDSVASAVARWRAQDLEDALAEAGMCGAMARSVDEWRGHPQAQALATVPRVEILKMGGSDPEPLPAGERPLSGVRVLDLTRILAGPTHARTLAQFGAEVLHISSPNLPNADVWTLDTNQGKLTARLDLNDAAAAARLRGLAGGADVFAQGYRAGSLERRGFGPGALAELRPGIIYVSINCYGHGGPWRERPGWEQLAQTVSGIAVEQGAPGPPRRMPAAACDYTTGYLAALGTMVALKRRATQGGSYHVRVSLTRTAMWFASLGATCDLSAAAGPGDAGDITSQTQTAWGLLTHLKPAVELSETPVYWERPPAPLGSHPPAWLEAA